MMTVEEILEFGPVRTKTRVKNMGILIAETTKEEREKIVADSIGNIDGSCDGCMTGLIEMYQPYIDGEKEIRDINMGFRTSYVSGDEGLEKTGCGYFPG